MIVSRWFMVVMSGNTMRPPFGSCANASSTGPISGITGVPTDIDPNVPTFDPAQLPKHLHECLNIGYGQCVCSGCVHQHADAPHPLGLLRARRERPSRRAKQRHEFASFQLM
jgi:hypothetical protein